MQHDTNAISTAPASATHKETAGLAAEIGKRDPFDVPEEEVYLNLLRTTAWLNEGTAALFKQAGLSVPLYNILRILTGYAKRHETDGTDFHGLPVSGIAQHMLTREPDMTRLIDRLEKLGLVERSRCPSDRRRVLVVPTRDGTSVTADLKPALEALHREHLGHLSADEQSTLNQLLHKARARMHASDDHAG
ncbi:MAG: MarR family transcriptional regulator [Planctomycetota bacterium]